jgi:hypothetical protein
MGLQLPELRQRILGFVREAYAKGETPSLGRVRRELGVSRRRLYQLFPGGLEQVYAEASIPVEEAKKRLSLTQKALEARETPGTRGNEFTAAVFERLERGEDPAKIVIELRADPDEVKRAYDKWVELKGVDPSALRKKLKDLEERLERLEDFMEWVGQGVDERVGEGDDGCVHMDAEGYCNHWLWNIPPRWVPREVRNKGR